MSEPIKIKGRASTVKETYVFVKVHEVGGVSFVGDGKDILFRAEDMKDGDDPGCMKWGDLVEFGIPEWLAENKGLI